MSFPLADWQFWVVTVTALGALWALVRPFVGSADSDAGRGACAKCGTSGGGGCGHAASSEPKLVTLGGRRDS